MAQLAQCLRFDLADALAGDVELLADFFQRMIGWRMHQVAYVENLWPRRYSNLSTAFIRPMLPSWIRSGNCSPRLVYFFAIEMTRRRFASTISFFARRALASPIDLARLISL